MKKVIGLVLVASMLVMALTACKPTAPTPTNSEAATPTVQAVEAPEKAKEAVSTLKTMIDANKKPYEIITYIHENYKYLNKEQATQAIEGLVGVLENYESQYNEDIFAENTQELMGQYFKEDFKPELVDTIKEDTLKTFIKELLNGGYKMLMVEGSYMVIVDFEALKQFQGNISDELKDYINIMAEQSNYPAAMDGGLLITWDEVAKRAVSAETYVDKYTDSPRLASVNDLYVGFTSVYISGMDNTPAFDAATGQINPDLLKSYHNSIALYKGSNFGDIIEEYVELLKEENNKNTEKIKEYVMDLTR